MINKQKVVRILFLAFIIIGLYTGCSNHSLGEEMTTGAEETSTAKVQKNDHIKGGYTIGICQYSSLNIFSECRRGFLKSLEEAGFTDGSNLTVFFENAKGSAKEARAITHKFVEQKVDLILTMTEDGAAASYKATKKTGIPLLYTAVLNPAAIKFTQNDGTPIGNRTGTASPYPVKEQLVKLRKLFPNVKYLAIPYTKNEADSIMTFAAYKLLAGNYGFELLAIPVKSKEELGKMLPIVLKKADAVALFPDILTGKEIKTIQKAAKKQKIPVIGSSAKQAEAGCVAAVGLDYNAMGRRAGKMAASILKGMNKASRMKTITMDSAKLYLNEKAADDLGITLRNSIRDMASKVYS